MGFIHNFTATSTASDVLAEGHRVDSCVIQALANDIVVNIGDTASASAGETVFANTSATFTNILGRNISVYAASSTNGSLREEI